MSKQCFPFEYISFDSFPNFGSFQSFEHGAKVFIILGLVPGSNTWMWFVSRLLLPPRVPLLGFNKPAALQAFQSAGSIGFILFGNFSHQFLIDITKHFAYNWKLVLEVLMKNHTCVWRNIYNTARATHSRYYKYFAKHACDFSLILLEPCNSLY